MYCKVCGNLLEESDLICKVCGADLKEQRQQAADETAFADTVPAELSEANSAVPRDDADDTNTFDDSTTSGPRERTDAAPAPEAVLADAASEELALEAEAAAPAAEYPEDNAPADAAAEYPEDNAAADAAPEELAPEAEVAAPAADEFRWNVHSFPSVELRKTEDVNFDWNLPPAFLVQREVSSLGGETEANDGAYAAKEAPIAESMEAFFERCANCESQGAGEADGFQFAMPNAGGDVLAPALPGAETAPESLGNTLGPSAGKSNRERFFTFDRKNEEFQKLLDREYERLQSYNSPIIKEAREMLTAGDAPADFADKRANPATKKRLSFAPQERSERDSDRDAAEGSSAPLPPQDALPRATEETLRETAQDESEPAAAPGDGFAAVETLTANALQARDEALLSIEELLKKVACDIASDVEAVPAAALAASQGEAAPAADDAEIAVRETEAAPAVALAVPQGEAPPAGAEAAPAVSQGEAPSAGAEAEEASAATEAELSISKALDSIEKEIEEWENRDRLSTASKVAMLISVIFLIFTGGSALVKNFAPHSPLDLWFDSVQLQAAATIKHSVDAVRVLFDGEDDESQESASQRER